MDSQRLTVQADDGTAIAVTRRQGGKPAGPSSSCMPVSRIAGPWDAVIETLGRDDLDLRAWVIRFAPYAPRAFRR